MTVQELIDKLKRMPPDAPVFIPGNLGHQADVKVCEYLEPRLSFERPGVWIDSEEED